MIKPIKRSNNRAGSAKVLRRRVSYLEDRNHKDHLNLTIFKSRNYNCEGPKGVDFEKQCLKTHKDYLTSPERSKGGKPSSRLFEEFVYSTPLAANLNEKERTFIERQLVNTFARNSAARAGWHVNKETGRGDLHLLIAAKDNDHPAKLTISSKFSNKKESIISVINRVSEEIILFLNDTRATKLKSAMQVFRERRAARGRPSLASELAKLEVEEPEQLRAAIESLGYEVTRNNDRTISVRFETSARAKKYNKENLLVDIVDARVEEMTRERASRLVEPSEEVQPELPEPTPEIPPVSPVAEKEEKKPKSKTKDDKGGYGDM